MILRLTELNGNLILLNVNLIESIYLDSTKNGDCTVVALSNKRWTYVRETVSEISLLLQSSNLVIK